MTFCSSLMTGLGRIILEISIEDLIDPPKKPKTEAQIATEEAVNLIDQIITPIPLTKVRRADAFQEYIRFKKDTGDTLTFEEFLQLTL